MPEAVDEPVPLQLDAPERGASVARSPLIVAGWAVDREAPLLAVLVSVEDEWWFGARTGLPRPDLVGARPDLVDRGAATAGWRAELDLTAWPRDRAELKIVVLRSDGTWRLRARAPVRLRRSSS